MSSMNETLKKDPEVLGQDAYAEFEDALDSDDVSDSSKDLLSEIASAMSSQHISTPDETHPKLNGNEMDRSAEEFNPYDEEEVNKGSRELSRSDSEDIIDDQLDSLMSSNKEQSMNGGKSQLDEWNKNDKRVQQYLHEELAKRQLIHQEEIKELELKHSEEIDDIFNQLNQVETEFQDQLENLEARLSKKNVMLDALGDQLSDLREQNKKLHSDLEKSRKQNDQQNDLLNIANGAVSELKESMRHMENEFNDILDNEREQHLLQIQQVQNDIATEAERQFSEANECYVSLKQDYDDILEERREFVIEIENLQKHVENNERKWKSDEASLLAEIARLKADLATSSADAAALRREFSVEMEEMIEREKTLQMHLKDSKAQNKASQISLTSLMKDNEKMQRENAELQSVCEELMTLVEGKQ